MGDTKVDGDQQQADGGRKPHTALVLLVALVLLGAIAGGLYIAVHLFGVAWSVVLGAGGGLAIFLIRSNIEKRREYEKLLNQQKREQYAKFIEFLNDFFGIGGEAAGELDTAKLRELRRWSLLLTLIGSDDVVRAWSAARTTVRTGAHETLRNYGRLFLAMRRDSGNYYTKLKPSDMLEVLINDLDANRKFIDE